MYQKYDEGWLEVITGCMFAGKTEELIRRIKVLEFAKKKILVFKPKIDNRYSDKMVVSHGGSQVESIVIDQALDILKYVTDDVDVIAIDEVQFFSDEICEICNYLSEQKKRVIVAGLDMDFRGETFGPIAKLMVQAEFVTKLTAVCNSCGAPATRSQRLINGFSAKYDDPIVMVGASESYEARCRHCHEVLNAPKIIRS